MLFSLPRYPFLNLLKKWFLTIKGARIGARPIFYPGVWIGPGNGLIVGDDVDFALDVVVTTSGGVSIGSRVLIGYRTQILSTNHVIPQKPGRIFNSGHAKQPVQIEDDVWIGANCTILPGVTIKEGSVVAAGSVVTKDVNPFLIVGGNPAKVLKPRN